MATEILGPFLGAMRCPRCGAILMLVRRGGRPRVRCFGCGAEWDPRELVEPPLFW